MKVDMKFVPNERYTLTLTHEYVDEDGKSWHMSQPVEVRCIVRVGDEKWLDPPTSPPTSEIINNMLDKMRYYLLCEDNAFSLRREREVKEHGFN